MGKLARLPFEHAVEPLSRRAHRTPRARTRYYAFLSYSHKDEELADWLYDQLEQFRVPHALEGRLTANGVIPKRLAPIFRDEHELAAADDLGDEIQAALYSSQFLIVLCSPNAARSRWTNAEIETFKRTRPDGCVLAAIGGGEPFASETPGREDEECLPPALRQRYDRKGRPTGKRAEPLAADLRGDAEERRIGFLKLAAGLLGVGLDELVQRETTRRHRRMAWLAAASLGGMAVTSTLAVTAFQARNEAREQRREAEGLVEFMVGDLKDKLEPIGRLDALDGVGSRVLAYYRKQDTSDLSDAGLMQRSRALSLTAQVAFLRGNNDAATRLYRTAMAGTAEAVRRSPDDPQRLFDHAQNVFWIGELARKRGQIDQAESAYREYQRLAERMVEIEPDNLKWRMEVVYANENVGIALKSKRRFGEAAQLFQSSVDRAQSLFAIDPGNAEYQQALSNILGWFADTESALGQLDSAIAARRREIDFLERFIADGKTDVGVQGRLIPAHEGLGILLTWRGEIDQGIAQYRLAIAQANGLLAIEPSNSEWRDMAADTRLELAKNLLASGHADPAAQEASAACRTADSLRARDPNAVRWRTLQTKCLSFRSRLALASGANPEALEMAKRALGSARAARSGDPIMDRYWVAAAALLVGDVHRRMGNAQEARSIWSEGLSQLPVNVTERPWEMSQRIELLRRLGRVDEDRQSAARLSAMGYRPPM